MSSASVGEVFTLARDGELGEAGGDWCNNRDQQHDDETDWTVVVAIMTVCIKHHTNAKISDVADDADKSESNHRYTDIIVLDVRHFM